MEGFECDKKKKQNFTTIYKHSALQTAPFIQQVTLIHEISEGGHSGYCTFDDFYVMTEFGGRVYPWCMTARPRNHKRTIT